jgi:hypothetical protein
VPAIVEAWYPGQAGGTAVAEVLFGDVSPAGRLSVTLYRSLEQLPAFDDYAMKGRTYRYFTEKRAVRFSLDERASSVIGVDGRRIVEPRRITIAVGGKQPGLSGTADAATTMVLTAEIELRGETKTLPP